MSTVRKVGLKNFRQHTDISLEFSLEKNIILGSNGCGKTTVIEAIHCLMLTKSFRTNRDFELIHFGEDFFRVEGIFKNKEKETRIVTFYNKKSGKKILLDKQETKPITSHVGKFPVVVASPNDSAIVNGSPLVRRRFLDKMLSQSDITYFENLLKYQRSLQNRNKVLKQEHVDKDYLEIWTSPLYDLNDYLTTEREESVSCLENMIGEYYKKIGKTSEIQIKYLPSISKGFSPDAYKKTEPRDIKMGFTNLGSHSDKISFFVDGKSIREYASSGERKMFLTILKLAESEFIAEKKKQMPILMFDDLFAGLDKGHGNKILNLLMNEKKQIFVTSTNEREIEVFSENSQKICLDEMGLSIAKA